MISYFANRKIRTLVHYCKLQLNANKIYYFDDECAINSFSPDLLLDENFFTIFDNFRVLNHSIDIPELKKKSLIFYVELQKY